MIEVQLPDGRVIEFPPDTAPDVMQRVASQAAQAAQSQAAPAAPAAPRASFGERFATGLGDIFRGAEQLTANVNDGRQNRVMDFLRQNPNIAPIMEQAAATVPMETAAEANARIAEREKTYQASRGPGQQTLSSLILESGAPNPGIDWARIGGNVVSTLPAGMAAIPTRLAGAIGMGAFQGGAMGGLQPVTEGDYGEGVGRNVLLGAGAGAVGGALSYGAGRMLQGRQAPATRPEAVELAERGVNLTPGQIAGGQLQRLEESVASIPFVGQMIRNRQTESLTSFNRATADEVLKPLGVKVPANIEAGFDLNAFTRQTISKTYDDVLSAAKPFQIDQQFNQDLARVSQQFMIPTERQEFMRLVRDGIVPRLGGQNIKPADYQIVREELGRMARESAGPNATRPQLEQSRAFHGLQEAFDELFKRSNPSLAPQMDAANASWAALTRMQKAAAEQGAREGVFTPAMLDRAVRSGDETVRRRAYAEGDALLQSLSAPAKAVLPRTVNDSGTTERALASALFLGGAPAVATGMTPLGIGMGVGTAGLYTPFGSRLAQALMLGNRPDWAVSTGRAIAPLGAAPAASYFLAPSANQQPQ